MKFVLTFTLTLATLAASVALAGEPSSSFQGQVLEVRDAGGYTYLL